MGVQLIRVLVLVRQIEKGLECNSITSALSYWVVCCKGRLEIENENES